MVLCLLALAIGSNLLEKKFIPSAVAGLMLLGLLFRTGWAFSFTVFLSLLGIPLSFYSFEDAIRIAMAIGINLLIAGLLISSKVRGVY